MTTTPTTHRDDWPCAGSCEVCYPLTGHPDWEADALDALAQADSGVRHSIQVNQLAAIIRKVDGNHDLGATALAAAILLEWPRVAEDPGLALDEQDRFTQRLLANTECPLDVQQDTGV